MGTDEFSLRPQLSFFLTEEAGLQRGQGLRQAVTYATGCTYTGTSSFGEQVAGSGQDFDQEWAVCAALTSPANSNPYHSRLFTITYLTFWAHLGKACN